MKVEFVEEPPGGIPTDRAQVCAFADELTANPGRWALYPWPVEASRALASRIKRGRIAAFSKGFDAVTRRGRVYVRYTGV